MASSLGYVEITCPNHHDVLINGLFNLFSGQQGVDLELKCGSQVVRAHRLIAEVFLPVSKTRGGGTNKNANPDRGSLGQLLEFMYRGTVTVREDRLEYLLNAAKQLKFQLLVDAVESAKSDNALSFPAMPTNAPGESTMVQNNGEHLYLRGSKLGANISKKTYSCQACMLEWITYPELQRHRLQVHSVHSALKPSAAREVFKCTECAFSSTYQGLLKRHQVVKHNLKESDTLKKPFLCTTCGKLFRCITKLKHHTRVHTKENPFRCPHCDYSSNWKNALIMHVEGVHFRIRRYPCTVCSKRFISASILGRHMRVHTKERPHKCAYCTYAASEKKTLKAHVNSIHMGLREYPCAVCGMRFSNAHKLSRHHLTHTKEKLFECGVCHRSFARKDYLKEHLKNVHKTGT